MLDKLCATLGYTFTDTKLLKQALTHRSINKENNERLEFLGDGLLNFIIAEELFKCCPQAREGALSRMRANLVNGEVLAEMAREFALGDHLQMGQGELKSGGFRRDSILEDAMEAIIGAIYLDTGLTVCRERVLAWYQTRLDAVDESLEMKDAKSLLQEYLQGLGKPLPEYKILKIAGKAHAQIFHVECKILQPDMSAEGTGSSRRRAERDAAQALLELIKG